MCNTQRPLYPRGAGSVPPAARDSPALAEGGAGALRHGAPLALCGGAGTARPSLGSRARGREPRVGHGTFLLRMGGEQRGDQGGRVGWTGHVGLGWKAMGQSREGTAVLPSLGPDGIAGVAPAQGHGKGVPSLHRDTAKVSLLPWQCCSWVTGPPPPALGQCPQWLRALSPSWQPWEKKSSGPVPQGTLPWVIPCLNPWCCPAQLTCRGGRWHTGLGTLAVHCRGSYGCAVLCGEAGGGSLSMTGLLQGDRAVLTPGLLLCPVLPSKCPKAPLPLSSSLSPPPQSDKSAGHFPPQSPSPRRKQAQKRQPSTLG